MLQGLKANFYLRGADSVTATRKALAAMYGMLQQHAAMLAFVEAFWVMGVVFLLMLPFLPLLQYRKHATAKPAAAQGSSLPESKAPPEADPMEADEEVHLVLH